MAHAEAVTEHQSNKQFYVVWGALLALTAIEVWLAYNQFFTPIHMLEILLALSIVKAGLIIAYFMHLKYEYGPMKIVLMSALVACLLLMFTFFPDALRLLEMGTPTH
jgi:cytochrome c oxidase subunit IV